jgi:hypothetical protein
LPLEKGHLTVGGWMGPSYSVEVLEKINNFCPWRDSKRGPSDPYPSLYTDVLGMIFSRSFKPITEEEREKRGKMRKEKEITRGKRIEIERKEDGNKRNRNIAI